MLCLRPRCAGGQAPALHSLISLSPLLRANNTRGQEGNNKTEMKLSGSIMVSLRFLAKFHGQQSPILISCRLCTTIRINPGVVSIIYTVGSRGSVNGVLD